MWTRSKSSHTRPKCSSDEESLPVDFAESDASIEENNTPLYNVNEIVEFEHTETIKSRKRFKELLQQRIQEAADIGIRKREFTNRFTSLMTTRKDLEEGRPVVFCNRLEDKEENLIKRVLTKVKRHLKDKNTTKALREITQPTGLFNLEILIKNEKFPLSLKIFVKFTNGRN